MSIEETIIALRCPELTYFFKIFPLFVSDTFYIAVIALGYWLAPKPRIFWKLGFLVPFSTLLTAILKNIFCYDRPDASLHLVKIIDQSSGFPSGDVLVSVVFWGMLIYSFRSMSFRIVAISIILCVMLSRVYLGVHTAAQVLGGLFFGIIIVWAMVGSFGRRMFGFWENGEVSTYWAISSITVLVCLMTSKVIMPLIFSIAGILVGYGLSLGFAKKYMDGSRARRRFLAAGIGLVLLWLVNHLFPKLHFETVTWTDAVFVAKYCIIGLVIFAFVPLIISYGSSRIKKPEGGI